MSDLEVTANAPSPTGKREHTIPSRSAPSVRTRGRRRGAGDRAVARLPGQPAPVRPARAAALPDDQALQPYRATWPGGFGVPDRLLRAAASVDGVAVTLARAALAPSPRPRYRPGLRNRLTTRLLTTLPLGRRIGSRRGSPAWQAPPAGRTRPRRRRHAAVAPQHPTTRAPTPRGHPVNRCGDRTTTPSTRVRHRGLMLAGLCLAAGPSSPGRWPTRRPCTACPPRSAAWAVSCWRCAAPTRRLTGRSRDAASTDPKAHGSNAAAPAAAGRQAAAAAPATQPDRPAHPLRPAPALLTPPRS
jgi:hypothetical protein